MPGLLPSNGLRSNGRLSNEPVPVIVLDFHRKQIGFTFFEKYFVIIIHSTFL